jgi:hypothetical protein
VSFPALRQICFRQSVAKGEAGVNQKRSKLIILQRSMKIIERR